MEVDVDLGKNARRDEHVLLKTTKDGLIEMELTGAAYIEGGGGYSGHQTQISRVTMRPEHARQLARIFDALGATPAVGD